MPTLPIEKRRVTVPPPPAQASTIIRLLFDTNGGKVVGEDRRVLPEPLHVLLRHTDLWQREQVNIDRIVGQLLLRLLGVFLDIGGVGRGAEIFVDFLKLRRVILEIIVGIGVNVEVARLNMADDGQIEIVEV